MLPADDVVQFTEEVAHGVILHEGTRESRGETAVRRAIASGVCEDHLAARRGRSTPQGVCTAPGGFMNLTKKIVSLAAAAALVAGAGAMAATPATAKPKPNAHAS